MLVTTVGFVAVVVTTIFGTAADDRLWFQPYEAVFDGLGGRDWMDVSAEGRRGSVVSARPDGTVSVAHAGQADTLAKLVWHLEHDPEQLPAWAQGIDERAMVVIDEQARIKSFSAAAVRQFEAWEAGFRPEEARAQARRFSKEAFQRGILAEVESLLGSAGPSLSSQP